ncbi:MAG TPA: hypothetical protein VEB42_13085, partial [Chitinophagaceae bacterium]|nr:hypothetical protein [Chitinophagaceae bacterium]
MHLNAAYISRPVTALLMVLGFFLTACEKQSRVAAPQASTVNLDTVRFSKSVYRNLRYEVLPMDSIKTGQFAGVSVEKPLPEEWSGHRVPPGIIEKALLLKLTFFNPSDSIQEVYFYPGAYFNKFDLFRITAQGNGVLVPADETPGNYRMAFRQVTIKPGDSTTCVAQVQFVRTSATLFYPAVVQKDFVESFLTEKIQAKAKVNMITYLAAGIMLMMIFYSIAVYRLSKNKEFLYYIGYAGSLALLFFL